MKMWNEYLLESVNWSEKKDVEKGRGKKTNKRLKNYFFLVLYNGSGKIMHCFWSKSIINWIARKTDDFFFCFFFFLFWTIKVSNILNIMRMGNTETKKNSIFDYTVFWSRRITFKSSLWSFFFSALMLLSHFCFCFFFFLLQDALKKKKKKKTTTKFL